MRFTQAISFRSDNPDAIVELLTATDRDQASLDVMGYIGGTMLANRDDPGHFMLLADFAEVDGDLSAAEEADLNNRREETEKWAQAFRDLIDGEPEWIHFDQIYRTGITGNLRSG